MSRFSKDSLVLILANKCYIFTLISSASLKVIHSTEKTPCIYMIFL